MTRMYASPVPVSDADRLQAAEDFRRAAADCIRHKKANIAMIYINWAKQLEPVIELDIPVDIED